MSLAFDGIETAVLPDPEPQTALSGSWRFTVAAAMAQDAGRGLVRLDPEDIHALGLRIGDIAMVIGSIENDLVTYTHARVMPTYPKDRGHGLARIDELQKLNAGAEQNGTLIIRKAQAQNCESMRLRYVAALSEAADALTEATLSRSLENRPVTAGDMIAVKSAEGQAVFEVIHTHPMGAVTVTTATQITRDEVPVQTPQQRFQTLDPDMAGLEVVMTSLQQTVLLPLRHPDVVARIFPGFPKATLLVGPAASGKSRIGQRLRGGNDVKCLYVNAYKLAAMPAEQAIQTLQSIFDEAKSAAPALIFLDDLDAVGKPTDKASAEERRVTAALLSFIDGLQDQKSVGLVGAIRSTEGLHPALCGGGRFERSIIIGPLAESARRDLFGVFLEQTGLCEEIDLDVLVERTAGWDRAKVIRFIRECGFDALTALTGRSPSKRPNLHLRADSIDELLDQPVWEHET